MQRRNITTEYVLDFNSDPDKDTFTIEDLNLLLDKINKIKNQHNESTKIELQIKPSFNKFVLVVLTTEAESSSEYRNRMKNRVDAISKDLFALTEEKNELIRLLTLEFTYG